MKMSNFCYLIILTVILPVRFIFPQDSSKIIILSGKVGATIDRQERDYFGLFKNFNSFDNAVFYQATDGNYYCKVTFGKNGELKDSVYQVQYGQLINTAIKINYFEDLKQGRTDIDLSGIRIYFASGEEIKNNKTLLINRLEHYSLLNELPLSTTKIDFRNLIKQKWQYGISVGMGYNSVDFDGLAKIFNILEEKIPQEGYSVPVSHLTFSANPLFIFSGFLLFANKFKGDIEYGFSSNTNGSLHLGYKSFSISVSYLIHQFGLIEPYVTAGFTSASFTANNDYHASVNQNGGMLESITIDGNSKGLRIGGGILLNAGKHLIVNFNAVYNASPNAKIKNNQGYDLTGYQTEVNTNGFVTGISLIYK